MTEWRMRIACWIPKATNTHTEYVIVIAFPLQKWLHKRYVIRTLPVLFTTYSTRSAMRSNPEHRQIFESAPTLWHGVRCVINDGEQVEKTSRNLRNFALLGC